MGKSAQAFRTISEAAAELELPQHVLRFWETRFSQIKPLKRGGGRRYYRPEDVSLLKGIQYLLYDKGFTIKGVQRILKDKGPRHVISIGDAGGLDPEEEAQTVSRTVGAPTSQKNQSLAGNASSNSPQFSAKGRAKLAKVMRELLECKRLLDNARDG